MKAWEFFTTLLLSIVCAALAAAVILTTKSNQRLQQDLQIQQQQITGGILGQQAQQIVNNVLQDMALSAAKDDEMRSVLAKHGFRVAQAPGETAAPSNAKTETAKSEGTSR